MIDIKNKLTELNPYKNYSHDDKGLGELFADVYKNQCRYNTTTKSWYIYNGKCWIEDTGNVKVSRYAKKLYDELYEYASKIENKQTMEDYSKFIRRLGQLRNRKIMVEDAKDKYPISNEQLDTDIYLFNCQNGTFNLSNFKLQPHNPDDLISKISNVIYNPHSMSNVFSKFISEVLENDTEKIEYLQKILGYALTGDTSQEEFYIFYGPSTRNGKSTLIEAIINMFGSTKGYAVTINPESLASRQYLDGRQASGDIARLRGYRFANANEAPKNMSFNVNLLKILTGRDTITAREIYQTSFAFNPICKIFFNTNYLPLIADDTLFTSNRVKVITFNKHFKEEEQNKKLKDELKSPDVVSEIFNWCIEGLKNFYMKKAIPPSSVIKDTLEYKSSNDILETFINECLIKVKNNSKAGYIYEYYKNWLVNNGYPIETKQQFFSELKRKNLFEIYGTVDGKTIRNVIIGYELKSKIKD